MMPEYGALELRPLGSDARLRGTASQATERLTAASPALAVMTDFAVVPAATIEPGASLDEANKFMIRRGVRSLLVLDHSQYVVGIITANDILGERPMQIALERNVTRNEVLVREAMTPVERMDALPANELLEAKIGHVVATLRKAGRQHVLVVETSNGSEVVRGIFSLSHIASALGIRIEASSIAGTFAEVQAALAR